ATHAAGSTAATEPGRRARPADLSRSPGNRDLRRPTRPRTGREAGRARREIRNAGAFRVGAAAALAAAHPGPRRTPDRWVPGRRPHAQGGTAPLPGAAARAGLAVRLVQ